MRTEGSKSQLFMLPVAEFINRVTIITMPTVLLRQDFVDQYNRDGILYAE